jgi:hypothetical protein
LILQHGEVREGRVLSIAFDEIAKIRVHHGRTVYHSLDVLGRLFVLGRSWPHKGREVLDESNRQGTILDGEETESRCCEVLFEDNSHGTEWVPKYALRPADYSWWRPKALKEVTREQEHYQRYGYVDFLDLH